MHSPIITQLAIALMAVQVVSAPSANKNLYERQDDISTTPTDTQTQIDALNAEINILRGMASRDWDVTGFATQIRADEKKIAELAGLTQVAQGGERQGVAAFGTQYTRSALLVVLSMHVW